MDNPTPLAHPARLEDIAQRVGISRSEVSRVLNNRIRTGRGVSQDKQNEIRRVAAELGYEPNRAARNLARGRTDAVGMPIRVSADRELAPHYHEIVGALTCTFSELGLNLMLIDWDDNPTAPLERLARARTCDGILLTDLEVNDRRPDLLTSLRQPFVVRGSAPRAGIPAVGMDNRAIGRMAIRHLNDFGHRRILFHNVGRQLMAGEGRYQGFLEAVTDRGIADTATYEDGVYRENDVYRYALAALRGPAVPTAIYAGDEMAALGFLRAISDLGLRVPDDISVMTSLNARFMQRVLPNIAAIRIRQDEVAAQAGNVLARLVRGEPVDPRQVFVPPVLIENASVGPPRPD